MNRKKIRDPRRIAKVHRLCYREGGVFRPTTDCPYHRDPETGTMMQDKRIVVVPLSDVDRKASEAARNKARQQTAKVARRRDSYMTPEHLKATMVSGQSSRQIRQRGGSRGE